MRPQNIYLSGPISGVPGYRYHFACAAHDLRTTGHNVFNPAESFDSDDSLPRRVYMRYDIERLLEADCVVLLPGWQASRGAVYEVATAMEINIPVFEIGDLENPLEGRVFLLSVERLAA